MTGANEFKGMLKPADSPTDILASVFRRSFQEVPDRIRKIFALNL